MPEVHAAGLDVHYVTEGQGLPLLLLHGATSVGTRDWGAQRPVLREERTLFMPDARGHGRTRWDVRDGWSYATLVDDALAFADAVGLERFDVMGLSMGARTALALASRVPHRVRSLIAVAVGMDAEPAASVAWRRLDPELMAQDDPAMAADLARLHDPAQGDGAWRRLALAIRGELRTPALLTAEELGRIRLPVLLACGDRDPWVPLEQAVRLKRQLPDSRLLVVPDCGHVVPAERASLFNPAMLGFLRRAEGA